LGLAIKVLWEAVGVGNEWNCTAAATVELGDKYNRAVAKVILIVWFKFTALKGKSSKKSREKQYVAGP